jgi:hypothetical protein
LKGACKDFVAMQRAQITAWFTVALGSPDDEFKSIRFRKHRA